MELASLNTLQPQLMLFAAAILLTVVAMFILKTKDHISTILAVGLFSLITVINHSILKAPDVAITEVAVGSALSTIFFLLALKLLGKRIEPNLSNKHQYIKITLFVLLWIVLCFVIKDMSDFGDSKATIHKEISSYYIENTKKDFAIPNIVTAILGGYRGMDTLFETTVILTAALGVFYILKKR